MHLITNNLHASKSCQRESKIFSQFSIHPFSFTIFRSIFTMNSTVSSPPVTILPSRNGIHKNFDHNNTLCTYEQRGLQSYSKLNGFETLQLCPRSGKEKRKFSVDKEYQKLNETSHNYLRLSVSSKKISSRENSRNKAHRTVLIVRRFRSVSYLQGKNCLTKTSATTKNRLLKRRKFSLLDICSERRAKYSHNLQRNIEIVKDNDDIVLQNFKCKNESSFCYPEKEEKETSDSSKEVQISRGCSVISKERTLLSKRTKVTEDRKMGETFLSSPLELIEIYPGKKKQSISGSLNLMLDKELSDTTQELVSMKSFPEESNSGFEIFQDKNPPLAGMRRNNSNEERRIVNSDVINVDSSVADNFTKHKTWRTSCKEVSNSSSCSFRNLDVFAEPTRDWEDCKSSTLKIDEEEKRNAYSNRKKVQETSLSSRKCTQVKDNANRFTRSTENVGGGNNSQKEEQHKIVKRIVERIQHSLKHNTNFIHLNDLTPVDHKVKDYSVSNNTVAVEKAENERSDVSNLYLHTNVSNDITSDRTCLNVIKNEIPKTIMMSEQSNYLSNTTGDLQSLQNSTNAMKTSVPNDIKFVAHFPELKSFSDIKKSEYALAEQGLKAKEAEKLQNQIPIEKFGINRKEDWSSKWNRNSYHTFEIDSAKKNDRSFANEKRYCTKQFRSNLVAEANCKTKQETVDCGDINVCHALAEIHEQLTSNWRKIENRLKVKNLNAIDSTTSTLTMQLLSKIISRCKSYVHKSNDSDLASVVVNKLLSNYVIKLKEIIKRQQVQFLGEQNDEKLETSKNYKCFPSGTISTSQSCKDEISNLIETMSNLIKGITPRNGEKESIKSPQKYKSNHRHKWNNVSSHNSNRSKGGPLRTVKLNFVKEDSSIETQMGIENKNKICVKPAAHNVRSQGREKIIDDLHCNSAGKKYTDSNRRQEKGKSTKKQINVITMCNQSKQLISRQKHRNCNIVQPVWKPAGVVRIPSSSSVASLVQKPRPIFLSFGKDRINSFAEQTNLTGNKQELSTEFAAPEKSVPTVNGKGLDAPDKRLTKICNCLADVKQRRVKSGFNKNLSMEIQSAKGDFHSSVGVKNLNIVKKKSNASVNENLKAKTKTEHEFQSVGLKESASFKDQNNLSTCEQSIKEQIKTNEDEPTRDTDNKKFLKTLDKNKDVLQTDKKSITKIVKCAEKLSSIIQDPLNNSDLYFDSKKTGDILTRENIVNTKADFNRNCVPMANASCMAVFSSSSDSTAVAASVKCCQTSFNSLSSLSINSDENQPFKKNNAVMETLTNTSSLDNKENKRKRNNGELKNTFLMKQEKQTVFANNHAQSLKMLKDFLCCQGVDVDLVNRAEKHLKEKNGIKQKGEKTVNKKSLLLSDTVKYDTRRTVSFAPFERTIIEDKGTDPNISKENRFLRLNSKSEHFGKKRFIQNDKLDVADCKENINDVDITPRSSLMPPLQKKTQNIKGLPCNVRNKNDAFSQTDLLCHDSKSLQTVPEETEVPKVESIAMETQTEIPSIRHVSIECQEARMSLNLSVENCKNVSTTTQTVLKVINDASTQISNFQITKATATEDINYKSVNLCSKNGEDYEKNGPSNVFPKSVEKFDNELENKTTCHNRNAKRNYYDNLRELLDQFYEIQNDKILRKDKKNIEINELKFMNLEAESSCSSSSTLHSEQLEKCAESLKVIYESNENFGKNISSKVITAVQIASLRATNFHRAMEIYMANLEEQFARKSEDAADKNILTRGVGNIEEIIEENMEEKYRKVLKTNSSVIISNRENIDKEFCSMTKISKLEIDNFASHLSSSYSDYKVKTVIHASKNDEVSKDINVSVSSEVKIPHKSDSWFLCESCNDVVHTYMQSLMEYLICETENENSVQCVRKLSSSVHKRSSMHLHFHDEGMEIEKCIPEISILSRKILLPLVYGIVCSVVFWCLQFSIKCDFGTFYNL